MSTVERPSVAAPASAARRGRLTARMLLASGLLMLVLAATFAVLLVAVADLRAAARAARDSEEVLATANELERLVTDLDTGVRGFVLTGEEQFLEPWDAARRRLPAQVAALERLSAGNAEQARTARQIALAATAYVEQYAAPLLQAARRGDPAARSVAATADGKRRVDAVRADFDAFIATERRLAQAQQERSDEAARRAVVTAVGGLAVSLVLVLIFAGYLTRAIVRPVLRAAQMAVRLAGGNLSMRLPATGVAEIGQLERAFNEMAGSLERNRDDLAELATEQAALRRVATLVARRVSPDELFARVAEEVGALLGADITTMVRFDRGGRAELVVAAGTEADATPAGTTWELEEPWPTTVVWQTRRSARVDDDGDVSGRAAELLRRAGVRSSVDSPIVVEGRLWGAMVVSSRTRPLPGRHRGADGGLHRARRHGDHQRRSACRAAPDGRGAGRAAAGRDPGRPVGSAVGGLRGRHPGGRPAVRRRSDADGALRGGRGGDRRRRLEPGAGRVGRGDAVHPGRREHRPWGAAAGRASSGGQLRAGHRRDRPGGAGGGDPLLGRLPDRGGRAAVGG